MVSRFDEVLHLMDPEHEAPVAGLRAGPCGRGPIDDGATVVSMQIWLFQNGPGDTVAMASGRAGEDARSAAEEPPYENGRWMIRTGLDDESGTFSTDEPARAVALAIVRDSENVMSVELWEQDVELHGGGPHHH